jgi:hypothetical protein
MRPDSHATLRCGCGSFHCRGNSEVRTYGGRLVAARQHLTAETIKPHFPTASTFIIALIPQPTLHTTVSYSHLLQSAHAAGRTQAGRQAGRQATTITTIIGQEKAAAEAKARTKGVDYTCVLDVQFGCAFYCRMRFRWHFQCQESKNYLENALDNKMHTPSGHLKRKCNGPLNARM